MVFVIVHVKPEDTAKGRRVFFSGKGLATFTTRQETSRPNGRLSARVDLPGRPKGGRQRLAAEACGMPRNTAPGGQAVGHAGGKRSTRCQGGIEGEGLG